MRLLDLVILRAVEERRETTAKEIRKGLFTKVDSEKIRYALGQLLEAKLIVKDGHSYKISPQGESFLQSLRCFLQGLNWYTDSMEILIQ